MQVGAHFLFPLSHLKAVPLSILLKRELHQTIAYWLMVRALYKHPVILNYNHNKLAKLLNLSHKCVERHIERMKELGWCELRNGHLYFKGLNKLKQSKTKNGYQFQQACVLIPVTDKKGTILELRNALIRRNLSKQQRKINGKAKVVHLCKHPFGMLHPTQKRMVAKAGGESLFSDFTKCVTLSNEGFGRLIGLSKYSGRLLQRTLREKGFIKTKSRYKILVRGSSLLAYREFMKTTLLRGVKYINGNIVQQLSNRIMQMQVTKNVNSWI